MLDVEIGLLERRREIVDQPFGANVDAVKQAVDQAALRCQLDVLDRHHRLAVVRGRARERDRLDVIVAAHDVEARIEQVERNIGRRVGLELEAERATEPLLLLFRIQIARDAREERAAAGSVGQVGAARGEHRVERRRGAGTRRAGIAVRGIGTLAADRRRGGREADWRTEQPVGIGGQDVDGGIADFADVAFLIGDRAKDAEPSVVELLRDQQRSARVHLLGEFAVDAADGRAEREVLLAGQWLGCGQVDGCAERAFLDIGRGRLAYRERRKDLGRENVEIETTTVVAAAIDVGRSGLRRAFHAVDADARERRAQPADRNVAAFATVAAGKRDAGNALHRFGQVRVRELADVLGDDAVDRGGFVALLVDRGGERRAETRDDDVVGLNYVRGRRRFGGSLRSCRRRRGCLLSRGGGRNPGREQREHRCAATNAGRET